MKSKKEKHLKSYFPPFISMLEEKFASSTVKEKEKHIRCFNAWLEKKDLSQITPSKLSEKQIYNFKKSILKNNISEKTAKKYLKTIRDLIEYLAEKDIITVSFQEKESDVQQIVNHYFQTKGYCVEEIKKNAKKRKIIYSRYTRPAKDLLELAGSVKKANNAIDKVAQWATSRNLDYAIETVFKKWPEIDKLKPKEKKKIPYFRGDPMIWSKNKHKWYVIDKNGDWLEFAGEEDQIQWKEED